MDAGEVCPECAVYLGRGPMAASGKFPTEEDYENRAAEWGTAEYASSEAFDAIWWEQSNRLERERRGA